MFNIVFSFFLFVPAYSPSNSFMTTMEEIEKAVYDGQALRSFYPQTPARLKKIEGIIKLAVKQGNRQFIHQTLGHALYTTIEVEKKKTSSTRRRKRCSSCVNAVKRMMTSIKKTIGKDKFEKFIGNQNDNKATLMFAIDDTGSMYSEIQAVKDITTYIVNSSRPNLEVDYILSPFNDPEYGRAIEKEAGKGKEFIGEIKALFVQGGGDCEEMAFTGILEALKKQPVSDSPLYVFTDAPPKDVSLLKNAVIRAKALGVHVYFFLSKGCGNAASFQPFKELARETCGQIFELPKARSEIAKMKSFTKVLLDGTTCNGGIGLKSVGKKKRSVALKGYKLMVDDTMEKILVSISSENSSPKITLRDPLGNSVGKTTVSKVTIFEVAHPKPGPWILTVPPDAGKHTYMFKGTSKSNLDFDFIFVIPRNRGTPLPISHPLTGKDAYVILIVREANKIQSSSLNLNILKEDGSVLHTASVRPAGTSVAHFFAFFPTPTVPFKLQLRGRTKKTFVFERNSKTTVDPSHVVVKVLYSESEFTVPRHENASVMFLVYSTGATETFDLSVKDTSPFNAHYSRSLVLVRKDRLAIFDVYFTASPSAVPGTTESLLVTVTGRKSRVTASTVVNLMTT